MADNLSEAQAETLREKGLDVLAKALVEMVFGTETEAEAKILNDTLVNV